MARPMMCDIPGHILKRFPVSGTEEPSPKEMMALPDFEARVAVWREWERKRSLRPSEEPPKRFPPLLVKLPPAKGIRALEKKRQEESDW